MLRLFRFTNGLIREMPVTDEPLEAQVRAADWIDCCEASEEEKAILEKLLLTDVPEQDDVDEIEASARCFVDQAGIHVHSLFLTQTEGRHTTVSVACILQPERLITIRDDEIADFRLMRMRARRGQLESHHPSEALVTVFEQKIENHADNLEHIHEQLDKVSYLVLEDEEAELEEAISQLAKLEDSNGRIRLCLMDSQRDISFLIRHLRSHPELRETCREIARDIETLMSHSAFLFEKINFLMGSTQGFINIEQNQIIKTFSIAAVVFLPPTLIASIYGMNFEFMPELEWLLGYPGALALMVGSGFAPYWYFKRKGWL